MYRFLLSASLALAVLSSGCQSVTSTSTPPPTTLTVSILDKPASLPFGSPALALAVSVLNDSSNRGVTWTIGIQGGGTCTIDLCGVLAAAPAPSFAAAYTAPLAAPPTGSVTVVITATSVADSSKKDTLTISYAVVSKPNLFKGGFAFLLRGYNAAGTPLGLAGVVDVDGQGSITGGELDLNTGGVVTKVASPLQGNYTVDVSFYQTTHGTLNITNFSPGGNPATLKFFLSADGKSGSIIEHDNTGILAAGNIYLQDATALSAAPSGAFAFGLDSDAPVGARTVEIGRLVLAGGAVTSGVADASKAGSAAPIYSASAITAGSASAPDANGGGTLSLTVGGNSTQYAYYIVNSKQFLALQSDSGGALATVQGGVALEQQALTAGSVNTTSVLQLTGLGTAAGVKPLGSSVIIGQLKISSGTSLALTFDSNDLGTVLTTQQVTGTVTSFNPATGRGVISVSGGFGATFVNSAVFYLSAAGTGFIIDTDPTGSGVANKAFSGTLVPQQSAPIENSVFSGNLVVLSGASSAESIPDLDAAIQVDNSVESFAGLGDLSSLPSQVSYTNRSFTTVYLVTDPILGHGNILLPPEIFGNFELNQYAPATFYVIAPNQAVFIGTLSGTSSGVVFYNP